MTYCRWSTISYRTLYSMRLAVTGDITWVVHDLQPCCCALQLAWRQHVLLICWVTYCPSSQLSNKSAIVRLRCSPWYRMYIQINFSMGFMFNTNVKILVNIKTLRSCTVSLQILVYYPEYVFEWAPNILLWWSKPNNFGILFYFPSNFRKQHLIKRYTFIRHVYFFWITEESMCYFNNKL